MPDRPDLVYRYDGTLPGFLTCVFEAFACRETPSHIVRAADQATLFSEKQIETDPARARRVWASLPKKLGNRAQRAVRAAYLHCDGAREMVILAFLRRAYAVGPRIFDALGLAEVSAFHKLAQAVERECHQLLQFTRFEEYGGLLAAVIEPKHAPLPLMRAHFTGRYPEERFLIYDKTNRLALAYKPYRSRLFPVDALTLPELDGRERAWQLLWAQYYKTMAIESRENPRCRMSHMPKRYWAHLPEIQLARLLDQKSQRAELPEIRSGK